MKLYLSKLVTLIACAVVYTVGVVAPACIGVYHEPDMTEAFKK